MLRSTSSRARPQSRGFGLVETVVVILAAILLIAILIPAIGRRPHGHTRQVRDSSHLRSVIQAQILWAQNNRDRFALPSAIDVSDATVPEPARAKDTSANIYSILLYNGLVTTELLVSPAELGNVEKYEGYELVAPRAAASPASALWDPAFRADFTGDQPGGVSYAHQIPHPLDTKRWGTAWDAGYASISNRGPLVTGVSYQRGGAVDAIEFDEDSLTLLFHGERRSWQGNVGFNDNHVQMLDGFAPGELTYPTESGARRGDVLFYDEPDSMMDNNFLALFTKAGDRRSDFKPIWD